MKKQLLQCIFAMAMMLFLPLFSYSQDNPGKESPVFTVVENMPEFPGGEKARLKFLCDNIEYPKIAKEQGIQGTVYVSFVVKNTGEISDIRILRGIGGGCDEEVKRIIALMPRWTPGTQAGKTVNVQFTMPVKFTLNDTPIMDMSPSGFRPTSMYYYMSLTIVDFKDELRPQTKGDIRFSGFPNIEIHRNVRLSENTSFYAGISIVNAGISVKDSIITKYRYYGLGIPIGISFKSARNHIVGKIGGGINFPYQLKTKQYVHSDKKKDSEYFSKQLNPVQTYVQFSLGYSFIHFSVKYFLQNFFNTSYEKDVNGLKFKPYEKTTARPVEFGLVFGN